MLIYYRYQVLGIYRMLQSFVIYSHTVISPCIIETRHERVISTTDMFLFFVYFWSCVLSSVWQDFCIFFFTIT